MNLFKPRANIDKSGRHLRPARPCRTVKQQRQIILDGQGLGMDKLAVAANPPVVGEMAILQALTHGVPSKDKRFKSQNFAVGIKIYLDPSAKAAFIKQDCFLWQPEKCATVLRGQLNIHAGDISIAAAIGALGCLCCHHDPAGICHRTILIGIAASNAARRIDQHHLLRGSVTARQQRLCCTGLINYYRRRLQPIAETCRFTSKSHQTI